MAENNSKRLALYPGTFDPVTNGHLSLIERAVCVFDKLTIAVADNAGKDPLFQSDERLNLIRGATEGKHYSDRINVIGFDGLLADLALKLSATAIIRGLRAVSDFEYEFQMALMNRKLARQVETVFLMPSLSWVYLTSTIVKDVAFHGGDIKGLVPQNVVEAINKKLAFREK